MPVIKSAKKKLRQDKKRQDNNKVVKDFLKKVVKTFRSSPTDKHLQAVYKAADKAVKKRLIHKNKAARLKSTLAKLLSGKITHTKQERKVTTSKVKKGAPKKKK